MSKREKKKNDGLYLSDRQPLTTAKLISLIVSYILLLFWVFVIVWPLAQIVISSFNGNQSSYISIGGKYEFSLRHFSYLFSETYFWNWVVNTIYIAVATALLTLLIVSFTGYAYSRFRFSGRKASLMAIMLLQTVPTF
ncbi:MAG: sugar ABC transporter permease, partial [Eubacteriales bacterium]|nr:sugar ABC transporter permease [Eubacteriales bacterium]